ncbi:MAG: CoA-transferase [Chloroflexota bacterium]|nr:CoA-transferase [Chloroflexota bacterium]
MDDQQIDQLLQTTFRLREYEGKSKVTELDAAIKAYVKPGMILHVSPEANGALRQIVRQYWNTNPKFTLIMSMLGGTFGIPLIHGGLVKRLIFTHCADVYPMVQPNAVIQRTYREKKLELENWSYLSLYFRLMAGALNIGFLPTNSLLGSSIAEENKGLFQEVKDPFENKTIGAVKALNPDVSIIHGLAADPYGNIIPAPFSLESTMWGAKASKNGVIATVENIVSTDFIREHSPLVKIPGYMVNSVSLVPLGTHPLGLCNHALTYFTGYGQDNEFLARYQEASQDSDTLDAWIKEWILDCHFQRDYLAKLGYERILALKGKADKDAWEYELRIQAQNISVSRKYNPIEMMIIASSRKIKEIVVNGGYRLMFAGVGASGLAGWLAYYQLKDEGYDLDLLGAGLGVAPRPGDPLLIGLSQVHTAKMIPEVRDTHGTFLGGINSSCLGVLGAGQIDRLGNINSSKISDGIFLAGSGGSNDIVSGAKDVVALAIQSERRFVDKVSYITCPGKRIRTLVSSKGIFEKLDGEEEFKLTGYFPNPSFATKEETIQDIKRNCGWDLKISATVSYIMPPTANELTMLRMFDPQRVFIE